MDDAWVEEPKEPFPQGPEADQPAKAAQPPPGDVKADKTEEEEDDKYEEKKEESEVAKDEDTSSIELEPPDPPGLPPVRPERLRPGVAQGGTVKKSRHEDETGVKRERGNDDFKDRVQGDQNSIPQTSEEQD
eukprot:5430392-Pyramimonas_sp.AAC.1